ncbi:MAG: hypothetical protein BWK75_05910 [Candidatus Altiarchaeales archaeon A3]|nr:MAG: hypothetical protein BWK75_05910 [Candidatus Altiarchaeales archaeon A3]
MDIKVHEKDTENRKKVCREVIEKILSCRIISRDALEKEKAYYCEKYGIAEYLNNPEILQCAYPDERDEILKILQKKPSRTYSGVTVIACMTMPTRCPHGKCAYCPGGVEIDVPQSYTGKEPSTMRGIQCHFDSYLETTSRLYQYHKLGHAVDKIELIIMGGTLPAQDIDYMEYFSKRCIQAMNEFYENLTTIEKSGEEKFTEIYNEDKKKSDGGKFHKFYYREEIQRANEKAKIRCVGLTFESRPDYAKKEEILRMLKCGATRIEMGVQSPYDFIYSCVNRGHNVKDVIESTALLKDYGLKICYHMMPGLLGNSEYSREIDFRGFKKIVADENFMPDMLKIYPTLIIKGTKFYDAYIKGNFEPLTTENAVRLITNVMAALPKWVRVMRVMRDIPAYMIEAGIKTSNLEQLVDEKLKSENLKCVEIRHRGVRNEIIDFDSVKLLRENYNASGGQEIFMSYEDVRADLLIGFLRLRIPSNFNKTKNVFVRELHIYGKEVEIGKKAKATEIQHRGFGGNLLMEAERIAKEEFDAKKISVMSGIGAREYYRKFNYKRSEFWMVKNL